MADADDSTTQVRLQLDRLRAGDEASRDELLRISCRRLGRLARKMLRSFPGVRRWEQTDDVLQNAALRLWRALDAVQPASVHEFITLAAVQIRRELIDLARHYDGPLGAGRHHVGQGGPDDSGAPPEPGTDTHDPAHLATWTEFHHVVEALPDEEKEIVDLLWYQGLPQADAAALLGVTERVVRYRWRLARLKLHERLGGRLSG
jgi:RNA polymerase sigma-70 factor (ECF subfamily)